MKQLVCSCCGHPLPVDAVAAMFTGRQRKLYEIVKRAGVNGIAGQLILGLLYDDDPDGGADSRTIVCTMVRQINTRLYRQGLVIRGQRGPGGFYRLLKLEDEAKQLKRRPQPPRKVSLETWLSDA